MLKEKKNGEQLGLLSEQSWIVCEKKREKLTKKKRRKREKNLTMNTLSWKNPNGETWTAVRTKLDGMSKKRRKRKKKK